MNIYLFLEKNNIPYERFDHPAVFTSQEAHELCPPMPGKSIKNIFLRDSKSKEYFLIILPGEKRINFKKLRATLNSSKLNFAPAESLKKYLGIEPGSVTILGLINDKDNKIRVVFDEHLKGHALQCHPLINTATLVLSPENIDKFITQTGHSYDFLYIPAQAE